MDWTESEKLSMDISFVDLIAWIEKGEGQKQEGICLRNGEGSFLSTITVDCPNHWVTS